MCLARDRKCIEWVDYVGVAFLYTTMEQIVYKYTVPVTKELTKYIIKRKEESNSPKGIKRSSGYRARFTKE